MSTPSLSAQRSDPGSAPFPVSSCDPARLIGLASALQDTAQALLAVAARPQAAPRPEPSAARKPAPGPADAVPHELRCYRVPSFIAQYEKEALAAHKAEDLFALFASAYSDLYVTAYLLENFSDAEEVGGPDIQMIGANLQSTLHVLNKVRTVLADFKPVDLPATA